MSLHNHTVSRELAIALKEAGWPQESLFYWRSPLPHHGWNEWSLGESELGHGSEAFASPTASELMERMPDGYFAYRRGKSWFTGKDLHQIAAAVASDSMPNALATLTLFLAKEGKMRF